MRYLALCLAAIIGVSANAKAFAAPCMTQGFADAAELVFIWNSKDLREGLLASFDLGLEPPDFPFRQIENAKSRCSRGAFTAAGDQIELFGENDPEDGAPRWTQPIGKAGNLFFLALMPRPQFALAWSRGERPVEPDGSIRFEKHEWMWALVAIRGLTRDRFADLKNDRLVFALYNKIPTDEVLKAEMKDIAEGRRKPFVSYNGLNHLHIKFEFQEP